VILTTKYLIYPTAKFEQTLIWVKDKRTRDELRWQLLQRKGNKSAVLIWRDTSCPESRIIGREEDTRTSVKVRLHVFPSIMEKLWCSWMLLVRASVGR